jgi:hypothetical protein
MTESAESNLLTLVKPWSTWVITSKTEMTIPNDPLYQVNTYLWSKLVKGTVKPLLKNPMSVNSLRNFCRVLQISPKHSKISQYKRFPVFQGTQLSYWMAFQILCGKGWKTWSTAEFTVHRASAKPELCLTFLLKTLRKTIFWRKTRSNRRWLGDSRPTGALALWSAGAHRAATPVLGVRAHRPHPEAARLPEAPCPEAELLRGVLKSPHATRCVNVRVGPLLPALSVPPYDAAARGQNPPMLES